MDETVNSTAESLAAQVHQRLRLDIMRSRFRPGEKLKLRHLATEMGVSSMPVRAALTRLVSEGALEQVDRRSVRVPTLSDARLREVVELRMDLEGKAASRAAECATEADVARLAAIHAEMTSHRLAGRGEEMMVENERFHRQLCAIPGMPVLARMVEGLWLLCGPLNAGLKDIRFLHQPEEHPHNDVIRALAMHDGALARLAIQRDISVYADAVMRRLPTLNVTQAKLRVA
ncbi:GntR family transcriptional regulator [Roseococcus sp. YIM B11640]|uniref:GntR family transcriptional regulator n=1 Tax=Roseococcus sp. YIM B11640 TaxID=3133973 RepID=UPI003C7ABC94